jgi:hypothetical protein
MPLRFQLRADEAPSWIKNGSDLDPQRVGERLHRLSQDNGGRLKPQHVVDDARSPRSPLHRHFDWNDKRAAEAFRRDQARELITLIIRVDDDTDDGQPRRAFLSVTDKVGAAYRTVDEVLGSRDLQLALWRRAESDLKNWEVRYNELLDICAGVREARLRLGARIARASREVEART